MLFMVLLGSVGRARSLVLGLTPHWPASVENKRLVAVLSLCAVCVFAACLLSCVQVVCVNICCHYHDREVWVRGQCAATYASGAGLKPCAWSDPLTGR